MQMLISCPSLLCFYDNYYNVFMNTTWPVLCMLQWSYELRAVTHVRRSNTKFKLQKSLLPLRIWNTFKCTCSVQCNSNFPRAAASSVYWTPAASSGLYFLFYKWLIPSVSRGRVFALTTVSL
ncbi:unnamed protein product [Natator depressus]